MNTPSMRAKLEASRDFFKHNAEHDLKNARTEIIISGAGLLAAGGGGVMIAFGLVPEGGVVAAFGTFYTFDGARGAWNQLRSYGEQIQEFGKMAGRISMLDHRNHLARQRRIARQTGV